MAVNNIAKRQLLARLSVTVGLLIGLRPVFAHHSDSIYDQGRFITVKGMVTQYEFVNPHVLIYVSAKDDKGNLVQWTTLDGPPNRMAKGAGWTHSTIKEGEELTITGYPFRTGRPLTRRGQDACDGLQSALLNYRCAHAAFDFAAKRGYCRADFPNFPGSAARAARWTTNLRKKIAADEKIGRC